MSAEQDGRPARRTPPRSALVVGGGAWYLTDRYAGNIDRVADVFTGLDDGTRPAPPTPAQETSEEPVTFLLVGSDTRVSAREGEDPSGRSDAIMIAPTTSSGPAATSTASPVRRTASTTT